MKKQWMLMGLLMIWGVVLHATVLVENVTVQQIEGSKNVSIQYDISSTESDAVTVSVEVFKGAESLVLSSLSGDVGPAVSTGEGKIVLWDAGSDWDGQVASCLQVWVMADDGINSSFSLGEKSKLVLAGSNSGTDPDFGNYTVSVASGFVVDQSEVNSNLWGEVYGWALANGYDFDNRGSAVSNNHPVVAINWYDSVKWCNARSEKEGFLPVYQVNEEIYRMGDLEPDVLETDGYRLPTISEWQFMARGCREGARFPWGDSITHSNANYYSVASLYDISLTRGYHPDYEGEWPGTSPCGAFPANGLGLYDMVGNVWEWCWDVAPEGRYLAGGSWQNAADSARCGSTLSDAAGNSRLTAGFRTVRSAAISCAASASVDSRDYTLSVSVAPGNPTPVDGTHSYAWRSSVTCSVDPMATVGGTNYYLVGWLGTGSIPLSGIGIETGAIMLEELESSIIWNWQDGSGDYDADLLSNDWEMDYFGSFTGAVAHLNEDGDLFSNKQEYIAGTDPTNASSYFSVTNQIDMMDSTAFVMEWDSIQDRIYSVQGSTNLTDGFFPLVEMEYPENSYTNTFDEKMGFFQVDVRLK